MLQEANLYCHHTSRFKFSLFTYSKKYLNTIIIRTKKEENQSQYTCYNKYFIGKVCSGQRSKAFGLATTTVQLLMYQMNYPAQQVFLRGPQVSFSRKAFPGLRTENYLSQRINKLYKRKQQNTFVISSSSFNLASKSTFSAMAT